MLKKFTYLALTGCLLLFTASVATPSPQEQSEKRPKDTAEYELINKTFKETNPQTKLQLLDEWKQKYADSDYADDRLRLYMRTYQQAGERDKAIATAKEVLAKFPGDFEANFMIASMTPSLGKTDAATLADGEKAATELLKGKPASLTDEQWNQVKDQVTLAAHQTLGWIHMQRKDNVKAEEQFKEVLKRQPNNAQTSYWLGNVVLAQGDPHKNELALFSFARAAVVEGEGALAADGRQQVDAYLTKVYTKYTGTEDGLPELKEMAKKQPLPPSDLKIESKDVREFKAEQEARAKNPMLYVFLDLKDNLTGARSDAVWADLRGKLTPKMELYVVGADSARPQTLNLSSQRGGPVEVVLNLENRLRAAPSTGSRVRFEGVASNLTKSPFRLTLSDGKVL